MKSLARCHIASKWQSLDLMSKICVTWSHSRFFLLGLLISFHLPVPSLLSAKLQCFLVAVFFHQPSSACYWGKNVQVKAVASSEQPCAPFQSSPLQQEPWLWGLSQRLGSAPRGPNCAGLSRRRNPSSSLGRAVRKLCPRRRCPSWPGARALSEALVHPTARTTFWLSLQCMRVCGLHFIHVRI